MPYHLGHSHINEIEVIAKSQTQIYHAMILSTPCTNDAFSTQPACVLNCNVLAR